jgi:hypothetical protein
VLSMGTGSWAIVVHMKNLCRALSLGLTALMGVLGAGCASAGRPATVPPADLPVDPPTYLAQGAVSDCRPWDSSMVCCIKKFPLTALSSCGATAAEIAEVLNGVKVLNEATQPAEDEATEADGAKDAATEEDDPDYGWKQHCRDTYVACKDQKGWVGDCYACFRYCEGQRQWPFHLCTRKGKVR